MLSSLTVAHALICPCSLAGTGSSPGWLETVGGWLPNLPAPMRVPQLIACALPCACQWPRSRGRRFTGFQSQGQHPCQVRGGWADWHARPHGFHLGRQRLQLPKWVKKKRKPKCCLPTGVEIKQKGQIRFIKVGMGLWLLTRW